MIRMRVSSLPLVALTCALLLPPAAWAQQASGIAGVIRDASGGVLPGVTAEATSPALIEKVRTVTSDGEGRYNILDLQPGSYVVTFTLAGFNTVRREGITLTAGFTATVNADMQVGSLSETITVSGAAPLVDTKNVREQISASHDLLDVLPTSTKGIDQIVSLTAGFTGNVSPTNLYNTQVGGANATFHGKGGTYMNVDGMTVQMATLQQGWAPNMAVIQEVVLQTSGISAEGAADGAVVNMIPTEGGNTFKGTLFGLYTNDHLQSDNLTTALQARGTTTSKVVKVYDETASLGGPIKRDRLWFFSALRWWGDANIDGGRFWNKTQSTPFYTPDFNRPGDRYEWYQSYATRLTWQVSPKNKVNILVDRERTCHCRDQLSPVIAGGVDAPEAEFIYHMNPMGLYQATWSSPVTNRLLIQGGGAAALDRFPAAYNPGVTLNDISISEQSTGLTYNARSTYNISDGPRYTQRFAVSYVTGSHAFKSGIQIDEGRNTVNAFTNGNVTYRFQNGVPVSLIQYATPYVLTSLTKADMGIYAQDQWTFRRLTLNYGLRFDYFQGKVPAQQVAATPNGWVPARTFAEVTDVPSWKDLSPRGGVSYDLFGNGRTALKMSLGRYVAKTGTQIPTANNPIQTSVNTVARTWADTNGNYRPDCDLGNRGANGECGAMADQNFGGFNPSTRYAADALRGFGARGSNWDLSAEVQHQLRPGVSVTGGYYRNWYDHFLVTDNLAAATPADYSPYCITAPVDPRLPGGGGYPACGLYDVSLAKFGQVNNLVTQASNYGKRKLVNDFFNVTLNTRFGSNLQVGGAFDTGRTVNDVCFNVNSPGANATALPGVSATPAAFTATTIDGQPICRIVTPFKGQTQVKTFWSYPFPGDIVVSGVFQSLSGPAITASYAASNAEIAPSLGRNLAACGARPVCTATATVPLVAPQTLFEGRNTRLDLRLTKQIHVGPKTLVRANVDLYNALNASSVLVLNNTYGSAWQKPIVILDGRLIQFSAQLTF